jgi:hypothetical protein
VIVALMTLLKAMTADAAEMLRRGGDGTLPLRSDSELESSDGTLPLRLGGSDGTLPLRFNGNAMTLTNPGQPAQQVATKVTLTNAVREALRGAAAGTVPCRENNGDVSKHSAAGTLLVGTVNFKIKGICYNHATTQMELVAERRVGTTTIEQSFLVGALESEQPQSFSGRMFVASAQSDAAPTRYSFSLQCPENGGRPRHYPE